MQITISENRVESKAVAYPAPELLTIVHGADGPEPVVMTADELSDLGWPVTVSDTDYTAHIVVPVRTAEAA